MNLVEDLLNGLEEWVTSLFTNGIEGIFGIIQSLLTSSFNSDSTDGLSGMMKNFLTVHPANFTGTSAAATGTTIWKTIEGICNNAVVPIAGMIFAIITINDLIQMVIRGNNFKDFDDSIFIKWILKTFCGVLLISNVYYIASGLFGFGVSATTSAIGTLFNGSMMEETLDVSALDSLNLGTIICVWFIALIVLIGVIAMIVATVIVLASRIIEVFMYLSISPIPVATLVDGGEFGSIGKNWIKQLIALSFQGFFIIVAIGIFMTLFQNAITTINNSDGTSASVILNMVMLLGYACALVFTILRTGAISKSAFNAH